MLKFDEEIKKFKPSLEVDHIQKNIKNDTMGDLLGIIKQMSQTDHILTEKTPTEKTIENKKSQEKNKDKE